MNYLWDWERVGRLKQRSDVDIFTFFSFLFFFSLRRAALLYAMNLWAGSRQMRNERILVVEA